MLFVIYVIISIQIVKRFASYSMQVHYVFIICTIIKLTTMVQWVESGRKKKESVASGTMR